MAVVLKDFPLISRDALVFLFQQALVNVCGYVYMFKDTSFLQLPLYAIEENALYAVTL